MVDVDHEGEQRRRSRRESTGPHGRLSGGSGAPLERLSHLVVEHVVARDLEGNTEAREATGW
jgi:hypothetical protein